jgi:hypothetical protein
VGSSLAGHEMYVLRCLLGIPLNMEMQLSPLGLEMWLCSCISRPGPESQARNAVVQLHFHPKAKYQTRNAVAQLHFQDQGSVSNWKCSCATAFPGQSLSIKLEMQLCNWISGPLAEKKFCQPPSTEGNEYFIPLTYIHSEGSR